MYSNGKGGNVVPVCAVHLWLSGKLLSSLPCAGGGDPAQLLTIGLTSENKAAVIKGRSMHSMISENRKVAA